MRGRKLLLCLSKEEVVTPDPDYISLYYQQLFTKLLISEPPPQLPSEVTQKTSSLWNNSHFKTKSSDHSFSSYSESIPSFSQIHISEPEPFPMTKRAITAGYSSFSISCHESTPGHKLKSLLLSRSVSFSVIMQAMLSQEFPKPVADIPHCSSLVPILHFCPKFLVLCHLSSVLWFSQLVSCHHFMVTTPGQSLG